MFLQNYFRKLLYANLDYFTEKHLTESLISSIGLSPKNKFGMNNDMSCWEEDEEEEEDEEKKEDESLITS